jgi:hypothetical protein
MYIGTEGILESKELFLVPIAAWRMAMDGRSVPRLGSDHLRSGCLV